MKAATLIVVLLLISTSIFTFLYFTKPRTITNTIIESIPPEVVVEFKPSPPDTVWLVEGTISEELMEGTEISSSIFASTKTFHKSFLYGEVESEVTAFAPIGVYGLENTIVFKPDRVKIAEELNKEIKKQATSSFWKGLYVGAGVTAIVVTGIILIAK